MRRALSQLCPASGPSWLAQLGASSSQNLARSAGEASTSYSGAAQEGLYLALVRTFAKPAAKGKGAPPPPPPPPKAVQPVNEVLLSAGARLRRKRGSADTLSLLTPQQRDLAEGLVQSATPAPQSDTDAAVPASLQSLGQLGLPLDRRDVTSLLHQSMSAAAGQNVHFQPIVFSNVFQSAPAVAAYVAAALESGTAWSRIERFFLAAVEEDPNVRGVKVEVKGRIGRKADMASSKKWQWGELTRRVLNDYVDFGAAPAHTRLGVLGVKVWLRYKHGAVPELFFSATGGSHHRTPTPAGAVPTVSLDELYGAAAARTARLPLASRFTTVGWWERPAPQQPPENRVSELFGPDFNPAAGDTLDAYLRRRREERRKFRSLEDRETYLQTTGRFLARRRRTVQLRAAASTGSGETAQAALAAPLGRRPNRALGRFQVGAVLPQQRAYFAVLRHRMKPRVVAKERTERAE